MKCCKCEKEIMVIEANEYYFQGKVVPSGDVDMYPANQIKVICQRCL